MVLHMVEMNLSLFCLVFNKTNTLSKAEELENKMNQTLYLSDDGLDIRLSASHGFATFPDDAKSLTKLLHHADTALFKNKKNRYFSIDSCSFITNG